MGYANDDIFFLESCLYSQVCTNGDELFALGAGEHWTCHFSDEAFRELQRVLLAPPLLSADTPVCTSSGRIGIAACAEWCTPYTCDQRSNARPADPTRAAFEDVVNNEYCKAVRSRVLSL